MILYWIFGFFLLKGSLGEEALIQVNTSRVLNVVNRDFIGYSINNKCLEHQRCLNGIKNFSSNTDDVMFVKIQGIDNPPKYENLQVLQDLTRSEQIEPIIVLNYEVKKWNPRQHLRLLQRINELGVKKCTFQLGADLNEEDLFTYADDLATFRFMIDAFRKFKNSWTLTGGDLAENLPLIDARIYTKLAKNYVGSFNWKQQLNSSSGQLSASIQHLVDDIFLPVSVTYRPRPQKRYNHLMCDHQCIQEGLRWAEELGTISQKGFSNIFHTISRTNFLFPDFSDYISQIYQKLMGPVVFKTKTIKKRSSGKFYAHCSKIHPGGLVLMAINPTGNSIKSTTRFPDVILGKTIKEVIVRAENHRIYINDRLVRDKIPLGFTPVSLEKIIRDGNLTVSIPPKSIGFWEIPDAKVSICGDPEIVNSKPKTRVPAESSMTTLLQGLIQEISTPDSKKSRTKRALPRLFPHQKRDVSEKVKQFFGMFNKRILGMPAFPEQPRTSPKLGAAQTYSAYNKPLIYTVNPQNGQVYESPYQLNPELFKQQRVNQQKKYHQQQQQQQLFQATHPQMVNQAKIAAAQPKVVQAKAQVTPVRHQMVSAQPQVVAPQPIAATLPLQDTAFNGQILPGQTYTLTEAELQSYLGGGAGYGGDQMYQHPVEYLHSPESYNQPIYLNSFGNEGSDGQLDTGSLDLSSLFQSGQPIVLPTTSGNQNNPLVYMMDSGYSQNYWDTPNPNKEIPQPKPESTPDPVEGVKQNFLAGKFFQGEPEVQLQMGKEDKMKYLEDIQNAANEAYAEELKILSELKYHEIVNEEKVMDKDAEKITARKRRSIPEKIKRNILDLDVINLSPEDDSGPLDNGLGGPLKNSLDDFLNFLPNVIKKGSDKNLKNIQTESTEMKKQCKILSVAMENECLHDTLDDIRSLAKRAVKYISRKKIENMVGSLVPPKLIFKQRRFIRSPGDLEELPLAKDLEDALKTNKIIPVNPDEIKIEDTSIDPKIDPIEAVQEEESKISMDNDEEEAQRSLNHLIHLMNSHILSWWNFFAK